MAGYIVRPVRPDEIDDVININLKTLPEHYSRNFYVYIHRSYPDLFLVAEVNGRIAGYIMCRIEYKISHIYPGLPIRMGHVISIAVLPEYRGIGIGTSLMADIMERMKKRGVKEIYLEVRISNYVAIHLYRKLGFIVIRILKGYYHDGEDAYLMARWLG